MAVLKTEQDNQRSKGKKESMKKASPRDSKSSPESKETQLSLAEERLINLAQRHMEKMPSINYDGKRLVVWTDIKEILFPSCSGKECNIVLNALKIVCRYPWFEDKMLPCTPKLHVSFLRQFRIIPPGTLLVDVDVVGECILNLWDMVRAKHLTTTDEKSKLCLYSGQGLTEGDNVYSPHKEGDAKDGGCGKEKEESTNQYDKLQTKGVVNMSFFKFLKNKEGEKSKNGKDTFATIPAIREQNSTEQDRYMPVRLLCQCMPHLNNKMLEVCGNHLVADAQESRATITRCCSAIEGREFTRWLYRKRGWDDDWQHLTSGDILVCWNRFIKQVQYSSSEDSAHDRESPDVCTLDSFCQEQVSVDGHLNASAATQSLTGTETVVTERGKVNVIQPVINTASLQNSATEDICVSTPSFVHTTTVYEPLVRTYGNSLFDQQANMIVNKDGTVLPLHYPNRATNCFNGSMFYLVPTVQVSGNQAKMKVTQQVGDKEEQQTEEDSKPLKVSPPIIQPKKRARITSPLTTDDNDSNKNNSALTQDKDSETGITKNPEKSLGKPKTEMPRHASAHPQAGRNVQASMADPESARHNLSFRYPCYWPTAQPNFLPHQHTRNIIPQSLLFSQDNFRFRTPLPFSVRYRNTGIYPWRVHPIALSRPQTTHMNEAARFYEQKNRTHEPRSLLNGSIITPKGNTQSKSPHTNQDVKLLTKRNIFDAVQNGCNNLTNNEKVNTDNKLKKSGSEIIGKYDVVGNILHNAKRNDERFQELTKKKYLRDKPIIQSLSLPPDRIPSSVLLAKSSWEKDKFCSPNFQYVLKKDTTKDGKPTSQTNETLIAMVSANPFTQTIESLKAVRDINRSPEDIPVRQTKVRGKDGTSGELGKSNVCGRRGDEAKSRLTGSTVDKRKPSKSKDDNSSTSNADTNLKNEREGRKSNTKKNSSEQSCVTRKHSDKTEVKNGRNKDDRKINKHLMIKDQLRKSQQEDITSKELSNVPVKTDKMSKKRDEETSLEHDKNTISNFTSKLNKSPDHSKMNSHPLKSNDFDGNTINIGPSSNRRKKKPDQIGIDRQTLNIPSASKSLDAIMGSFRKIKPKPNPLKSTSDSALQWKVECRDLKLKFVKVSDLGCLHESTSKATELTKQMTRRKLDKVEELSSEQDRDTEDITESVGSILSALQRKPEKENTVDIANHEYFHADNDDGKTKAESKMHKQTGRGRTEGSQNTPRTSGEIRHTKKKVEMVCDKQSTAEPESTLNLDENHSRSRNQRKIHSKNVPQKQDIINDKQSGCSSKSANSDVNEMHKESLNTKNEPVNRKQNVVIERKKKTHPKKKWIKDFLKSSTDSPTQLCKETNTKNRSVQNELEDYSVMSNCETNSQFITVTFSPKQNTKKDVSTANENGKSPNRPTRTRNKEGQAKLVHDKTTKADDEQCMGCHPPNETEECKTEQTREILEDGQIIESQELWCGDDMTVDHEEEVFDLPYDYVTREQGDNPEVDYSTALTETHNTLKDWESDSVTPDTNNGQSIIRSKEPEKRSIQKENRCNDMDSSLASKQDPAATGNMNNSTIGEEKRPKHAGRKNEFHLDDIEEKIAEEKAPVCTLVEDFQDEYEIFSEKENDSFRYGYTIGEKCSKEDKGRQKSRRSPRKIKAVNYDETSKEESVDIDTKQDTLQNLKTTSKKKSKGKRKCSKKKKDKVSKKTEKVNVVTPKASTINLKGGDVHYQNVVEEQKVMFNIIQNKKQDNRSCAISEFDKARVSNTKNTKGKGNKKCQDMHCLPEGFLRDEQRSCVPADDNTSKHSDVTDFVTNVVIKSKENWDNPYNSSVNTSDNAGSSCKAREDHTVKTDKTGTSTKEVLIPKEYSFLPQINDGYLVTSPGGNSNMCKAEPPGVKMSSPPMSMSWTSSINNGSLCYQPTYGKDGLEIGGLICHTLFVIPYVLLNGYKFVTVVDAARLFTECSTKCSIARQVLLRTKILLRTFCTWEQVYTLDLIYTKRGRTIKTGDALIKLDSLLTNYAAVWEAVKDKHKVQRFKNSSMTCKYELE